MTNCQVVRRRPIGILLPHGGVVGPQPEAALSVDEARYVRQRTDAAATFDAS